MKNYDNGFRHITVFGESQEQKDKLDNFLKENNYDIDETGDAVMVLTKEIIGTNTETDNKLKTFMTRLSEEEALEFECSIQDICSTRLDDIIDSVDILQVAEDILSDFENNKGELI